MTRHVLIRDGGSDQLVPESPLPAEANLHDALAAQPQLIPAADLGLGATVVVGRESNLASGYADLILIDEMGQVCLMEVKREGNPDTRQVVAQLFDYAASLWGQTLETFMEKVVRPYLRGCGKDDNVTLEEFVASSFAGDGAEGDLVDVELVTRNLAVTLAQGSFVLVVAAPKIPEGVERVLGYLNAQRLRLYALEVEYYRSDVECFVPRLSVTPPAAAQPLRSSPATPVDREELLQSLPEPVSAVVADALDAAEEAGATLSWNTYGVTIKVALEQTRMVGAYERQAVTVTVKPPGQFRAEPFDRALQELERIGVGAVETDPRYYRVRYTGATAEKLREVAAVVTELARELVERVNWEELPAAREVAFARNDNNVWARHTPPLREFLGCHLRGQIARASGGEETAIELLPLGGGSQGWKPQFRDGSARDRLWPANDNTGDYRLVVTAVGRRS